MYLHSQNAWLYIIGMSAEGVKGLSKKAQNMLEEVSVFIGPDRYLNMILLKKVEEKWTYPSPFLDIITKIKDYHNQYPTKKIGVLATGDPMHFGIGSTFVKYFEPEAITIVPQMSAFTLAASRLLWPLAQCRCISLHGRDITTLGSHLLPEQKLFILSHDKNTPHHVHQFLQERGYGQSTITILERMGYENERIYEYNSQCQLDDINDFHTLAVTCRLHDVDTYIPPVPGIESRYWQHDGKITRPEIRAITMSALKPYPGMILWDVGAGSGSVAIELLRLIPDARAICIEKKKRNLDDIMRNAHYFGCQNRLQVHGAEIADIYKNLETPDAIFIGGGIDSVENVEKIIDCLPHKRGVVVVHAVTIESEQILMQLYRKRGGKLKKIHLAHSDVIGDFSAFRYAMCVTQWCFTKSVS